MHHWLVVSSLQSMHLLDCALYTTQHPVSISLPNKVESGIKIHNVVVVQSFIRGQLFSASWTAALQASLSFTISWSLLKLMSIESVMPSNHLILYRPLLLLSSIFPSIRVFSNESSLCIRWPKCWSFSFSSLSKEYSVLISFRIDWF